MTEIAFLSAKGSPGVTTTVCALGAVWSDEREPVVVECDPFGGDVAVRFGLRPEPGLTTFVLGMRHGAEQRKLEDHFQRLPGGLSVILGAVGSDVCAATDRELAGVELDSFPDVDLLWDCGRFDGSAAGALRVITKADLAVLVGSPGPGTVAHGRSVVRQLEGLPGFDPSRLGFLVVGEGEFTDSEMAESLELDGLGRLPWDSRAASVIGGNSAPPRTLARSALIAEARTVATVLKKRAQRTDITALGVTEQTNGEGVLVDAG